MLDKGDSVGLVACSDGFPNDNHEVIEEVENSLYDMGYKAVTGNIYCTKENRTLSSKDRADVFNEMVRNPEIKVVFDISGGDSANEILDYVDYDMLEENGKPVFGYSDLTTLLNAIYCKTGICTYLYQIRNIITGYGERQKADLEMVLSGESDDLYDIDYEFVRGEEMAHTASYNLWIVNIATVTGKYNSADIKCLCRAQNSAEIAWILHIIKRQIFTVTLYCIKLIGFVKCFYNRKKALWRLSITHKGKNVFIYTDYILCFFFK